MELREAKLIIPLDGCGDAIPYAEEFILAQWGGFTAALCDGAWRDDLGQIIREPSRVYTIAMEPNGDSRVKLHRLGAIVADMGRQNCVYVRHASGIVELVNAGQRYPWAGKVTG